MRSVPSEQGVDGAPGSLVGTGALKRKGRRILPRGPAPFCMGARNGEEGAYVACSYWDRANRRSIGVRTGASTSSSGLAVDWLTLAVGIVVALAASAVLVTALERLGARFSLRKRPWVWSSRWLPTPPRCPRRSRPMSAAMRALARGWCSGRTPSTSRRCSASGPSSRGAWSPSPQGRAPRGRRGCRGRGARRRDDLRPGRPRGLRGADRRRARPLRRPVGSASRAATEGAPP